MVKYSLGQHLGNQLISVTADRLRQIVKSPNILARMRGDEFIILLDHL
jgi:GGDEF domain-containing protein